jgi:kumamolisin
MARGVLKGSERAALPGASVIRAADPAERLEVSVLVRRGAAAQLRERVAALSAGDRSQRPLSRGEFAARHGAAAADFAAVRAFAGVHGLNVVQENAGRRTLVLAGTVAQCEAAFSIRLNHYAHPDGSYRGRTGSIELPDELLPIVEAVLGLDARPQASPRFRLRRSPRAAAAASYSPLTVAALYGFPQGTGAGECVGLIELGGGYRPADLSAYFTALGLTPAQVSTVSVDHGKNAPTGSADGPDGEVMLDIEVVGAIAPEARIVCYFAPNTDAGFLDAVTTAIHDATNKPSVISISWGGAESTWTAQAKTAMDDAFQAAASMGITVCVAAGDNGSSDGVNDGADHVDFPASSPYALACGGTTLEASATAISAETVWNDGSTGGATGGGISSFFPAPAYQTGLSAERTAGAATPLSMRGVPDVAGDADPETGYQVRIDGTDTVIGGTSAVAPLWAGLIARINQINGTPAGYLQPKLYQNPQALRDVTVGNNGDFAATEGWDACTGLGSPNGASLSGLL